MDTNKSRQSEGIKDTSEKNKITLNFITLIEQLLNYTTFNIVVNKIDKEGEHMIQIFLYMISIAEECKTEYMKDFFEYVNEINFSISPQMVFELIKDFIRNKFPEVLTIKYPRYRVQAILLGEYSKENSENYSALLLPKDNFYFKKNEETPLSSNDVFPYPGVFPSKDDDNFEGFEDVCIFDIEGNMVFWGDLSEKYITELVGTYYVLDNSNGLGIIPKFAKNQEVSLKWSVNKIVKTFREKHGLKLNILPDVYNINPDYLRAIANWKILGGEILVNPSKTDIL